MSSSDLKSSVMASLSTRQPEPRKSDRTREAILEAALDFLWTHPFRDLTVSKLMKVVGLSRSAFYKYFDDVYDLVETLLRVLESDIFRETSAWFEGSGDSLDALYSSLVNLVEIAHARGPILRAVSDAARGDERLERTWNQTLAKFDDAITAHIEQQQQEGTVPAFEARPIAMALNRMDVAMLINAFGRRPRRQPEPIVETLFRIWSSTLYGEVKSTKRTTAP
jgi:AcrR family transcriptional regulator